MSEIPPREEAHGAEAAPEPAGRRVGGFVAIFVVTVLFLLTAYRYTVDTRVNDWYLFQVARHTSWVLDKIGHSSELENRYLSNEDPARVRATLAAWGEGREAPSEDEVARSPKEPLTPWEKWSYRALQARRAGKGAGNGPGVSFILRPGISTEISDLSERLSDLDGDTALAPAEREKQQAPLLARLTELQEIQQEIRRGERPQEEDTTRMFPFVVVSECGAIEVMAIFLAAVLAFPATWRKKAFGLVAGVPLMYSVNIFRLSFLGVVGALDTEHKWFKFAHEYVWQAVYIVFVVAVWLAWVEYIVKRKTP
ncbi:MAG TPA: exosortase/archaeosortase family protein [Candidatus Hydrogenedentes bacterium]|nr:exosortase/archaeosortase family protein [Candidatus Hydrogenedentota bacterium]